MVKIDSDVLGIINHVIGYVSSIQYAEKTDDGRYIITQGWVDGLGERLQELARVGDKKKVMKKEEKKNG